MKRPRLFYLFFFFLASPVLGNDWPQWRGPNRDGYASGAKLPKQWPEKLPAPRWSNRIGEGYSSPVIAGGRVFILGREEAGKESCLCFDAETGKPLWRVTYPCAFQPPDPTAGKGPNGTPTVDKDRVYMLGLGGMFHCLDTQTGQVLWKHDFAQEYWGVEKTSDGDDAWFPVCGASASALVVGEQVIVPVGGKKAGAFTAFHRKTGAILWKALNDRSSYASPLVADLAGTRQVVGFTGLRMVGLDFNSQKLLWEFPFTALFEQTIISPVLWRDRVIICGEAKPTVALELAKEGDKIGQKVAWRSADLSAYMATPVVVKNHLIGFDQRSKQLVCLELETGKTIWRSPRIGRIYVSLVVAGDRILALNDSGDLHLLEANPKTYTPLGQWKVSEAGGTWSYLGVAGSRLYIKDKEHLLCYDLSAS
jgi:outer membrane protein assembly factor BamB